MYIAEFEGIHQETNKPFVIKFEALPVRPWHWHRPSMFSKPWLIECLVDINGTTYHHSERDFWVWTLRSAVRKVYEQDDVWWEVRRSPAEEWW